MIHSRVHVRLSYLIAVWSARQGGVEALRAARLLEPVEFGSSFVTYSKP